MFQRLFSSSLSIKEKLGKYLIYLSIYLSIFICVFFSSCGTAKAEELDQTTRNIFEEYYDWVPSNIRNTTLQYGSYTIDQTVQYLYANCPYVVFAENEQMIAFMFHCSPVITTGVDNYDIGVISNSIEFNTYRHFYNTRSSSYWTTLSTHNYAWSELKTGYEYKPYFVCAMVLFDKRNQRLARLEVSAGNMYGSPYSYNISGGAMYGYSNNYDFPFYAADTSWWENDIPYENLTTNYENGVYVGSGNARIGSSNVFYKVTKLHEDFAWTDDDRLEIYELQSNTGTIVNFDLKKFDFDNYKGIDAATQYYLEDEQIEVVVNYDGTEQTFTFNDTNASILSNYVFQIPLSYFNVDVYEDVYVSKVSFNKVTHYRPQEQRPDEVESFKIACEYYLKRTNIPIESDPVQYDDDVSGIKISQVEYDDILDKVNFSSGSFGTLDGDISQFNIPFGYDAKLVVISGSRPFSAILNDIVESNLFPDYDNLVKNLISSITGITTTDQAIEYIEESVKNNEYSQDFDIVIYYWAPDNSLAEMDQVFYYLTTAGRIRGVSQIAADILKNINQVAVNTKASYDFLYSRLNDFEDKTLYSLGIQKDLLSTGNNWLQTINNSINGIVIPEFPEMQNYSPALQQIITSLSGIQSYDDTNLLTELGRIETAIGNISPGSGGSSSFNLAALSAELQYIFTPRLQWDELGYDDFHDSLGVLALPFDFTFDTLQIMESSYNPNFALHINELSVDVPDLDGQDVTMEIFDDQDLSFNPRDIFSNSIWNLIQYLNAFLLVVTQSLSTYCHIFRSGGD